MSKDHRGRVHFEPPPDMPRPLARGGSRPVFASALLIFRGYLDRGSTPQTLVTSTTTPRLREDPRQMPLAGVG